MLVYRNVYTGVLPPPRNSGHQVFISNKGFLYMFQLISLDTIGRKGATQHIYMNS